MRFYVTTPIYYVNDEPHIGHAYTTIAADVLAPLPPPAGRRRLLPHRHRRARQQGRAGRRGARAHPQQHVRRDGRRSSASWPRQVDASNDFFIRTTDPEHEAFVQQFVEKLQGRRRHREAHLRRPLLHRLRGLLRTSATCVDGQCPDHGIEPTWLEEENYYFLLSNYQDRLAEFFRANPDFVKPRSRYNEAL